MVVRDDMIEQGVKITLSTRKEEETELDTQNKNGYDSENNKEEEDRD